MPTKPERQALAFFAVIAVLGVAVRVLRSDPPPVPSVEERLALASQVAATDSAAGAAAERKAGKGKRNGSGRTRRQNAESEGAGPERMSHPGTSGDRWIDPYPVAPAPASPDRQAPLLNPDDATAAELERLPWVGPALAARIVADREARGAFGSVEGLTRVRGIGPKLAERLRPLVTFTGPVRPPSAAPGGAVTRAGERFWVPAGHSPRP